MLKVPCHTHFLFLLSLFPPEPKLENDRRSQIGDACSTHYFLLAKSPSLYSHIELQVAASQISFTTETGSITDIYHSQIFIDQDITA
jgi:hypothetical protein